MRSGAILIVILSCPFATAADGGEIVEPRAHLEVTPREATIGDRLEATLSVLLPDGGRLEAAEIGPRLGSFAVLDGTWRGPDAADGGQRRVWSGWITVFRTGAMQVPPVRVEYLRGDGSRAFVESAAVDVTVRSVLSPEEVAEGETPELAGLKPPASLEPDYSGLRAAVTVLALLVALGALGWWLLRRFAARLARVEMPEDPFHRVPPHLWAREALQALVDRRLAEQGHFDPFFEELARIAKLYLGGRYRVDLLERTSSEVPEVLERARTPAAAIRKTRDLLGLADRVKFAGERPAEERCRDAVDSAYAIVEQTRPREEARPAEERGAA